MIQQMISGLAGPWATLGTGWAWVWLLKGSAFLALLFLLVAVLKSASPSARHLVWAAGLGLALTFPLASAGLPAWRVPVPASVAAFLDLDAPTDIGSGVDPGTMDAASLEGVDPRGAAEAPDEASVSGASGRSDTAGERSVTAGDSPATAVGPFGEAVRTVAPSSAWRAADVFAALLVLWTAGALFFLLRLAASAVGMSRMVRRARPVDDPAWTRPLLEISDRFELATVPRLLLSYDVALPMTAGLVRPAIVLPPSSSEWSAERREAVLCHEVAHVRRRDLFAHLIGHVACALYWFQPLAWGAARRMRAESERSADDMVLSLGTRPSAYADHLLQIATAGHGHAAPVAAIPMAQPREFERRLLSILAPGVRRGTLGARGAAALVALVLFCAAPLIALTPTGPVSPAQQVPSGRIATPPVPPDDATPPVPPADVAAATATSETTSIAGGDAAGTAASGSRSPSASASASATPASDVSFEQSIERSATTFAETVSDAVARALGVTVPFSGPAAQLPTGASAALVGLLANDSDGQVRRTAAWALGQEPDSIAVRALALALETDEFPEVREMSAWALAQQGRRNMTPDALDALARALVQDENVDVRSTVAWALGDLEVPGTEAALELALASDPDDDVRYHAAWALGQIEASSSRDALAAALTASGPSGPASPRVKSIAAWALGQIGESPAPPGLLAALADADPEVRGMAAWALGQIEDPASVPALTQALSDADAGVRAGALWALGEMSRQPGAIEALTRALQDTDPNVRQAAARALGGGGNGAWPQPRPMPRPRPGP